MIFSLYYNDGCPWEATDSQVLFSHEHKTQEDFRNDVRDILAKHGESLLGELYHPHALNDFYYKVREKLPEYGYSVFEPEEIAFVDAIGRWDDLLESYQQELEWLFGKDLLKKIRDKVALKEV